MSDPLRHHREHEHLQTAYGELIEANTKLTELIERLTEEIHRKVVA